MPSDPVLWIAAGTIAAGVGVLVARRQLSARQVGLALAGVTVGLAFGFGWCGGGHG